MPQTGIISPFPPTKMDGPLYLGDPTGISAYADERTDEANSYLLKLGDLSGSLVPPLITPVFPTGPAAPAIEVPVPPTVSYPVWTAPVVPSEFTTVLDISDLTIDPFDVDPPTLVYPGTPTPFTATVEDAPTLNLAFTDPTLSLTLPDVPTLLSINVTPFDGLNMPTLSADEPVLDLVEPSVREYVPGANYTSSLLTALQTSLQERITTGGTGINADVEQAIWDRGREREAKSYRDAVKSVDQMEELGYMLPPGAFAAARLQLITERDAQDRGHTREVMVKSAELELDNVKHALTTATQLEGQLINYANSVEQRLFESCRYVTEAGVQIYNAKVQAFAALVDVYRAKVQAYGAQIQAETAKVDAYRALIEGERAKAEVNTALIQQYKVSADVALSAIEVYKAELSGIQTKAEIEKTKIEIYGEQVRAYGARVNAYTAGVEGYRAQLEGERTKSDIYRSQVEAFSTQVNATVRTIEARVAVQRSAVEAKSLEWDGYKAQSAGELGRIQAFASVTSSIGDIYRSEVSGISSFNEVLAKQWQTATEQSGRTAEIAINAAKMNGDFALSTRGLALDAAKIGGTIAAQLGAAALNAINWSSSISNSESYSNSSSNSLNQSFSDSDSTSYNYNYSA